MENSFSKKTRISDISLKDSFEGQIGSRGLSMEEFKEKKLTKKESVNFPSTTFKSFIPKNMYESEKKLVLKREQEQDVSTTIPPMEICIMDGNITNYELYKGDLVIRGEFTGTGLYVNFNLYKVKSRLSYTKEISISESTFDDVNRIVTTTITKKQIEGIEIIVMNPGNMKNGVWYVEHDERKIDFSRSKYHYSTNNMGKSKKSLLPYLNESDNKLYLYSNKLLNEISAEVTSKISSQILPENTSKISSTILPENTYNITSSIIAENT